MGSGLWPMIIMSSTSMRRSQPAFALEMESKKQWTEFSAAGSLVFKCKVYLLFQTLKTCFAIRSCLNVQRIVLVQESWKPMAQKQISLCLTWMNGWKTGCKPRSIGMNGFNKQFCVNRPAPYLFHFVRWDTKRVMQHKKLCILILISRSKSKTVT